MNTHSLLNETLCYEDALTECILNLGTRWRSVVSFTPRPLYFRGKSHLYPSGGWVGRSDGETKDPLPSQELNPCRPARNPASTLSYTGSRFKLAVKEENESKIK
jgi:hypothetical protein